jgi:hypothetical protein
MYVFFYACYQLTINFKSCLVSRTCSISNAMCGCLVACWNVNVNDGPPTCSSLSRPLSLLHKTWIILKQFFLCEVCLLFTSSLTNFRTTEGCKICWRCAARDQFLNNIPEVLSNLVGQQSARRGAMKVFETLQDPKLNKQLFYVSSALLRVTVFDLLHSTRDIHLVHDHFWAVNMPSPVK